MPDPAAGTWECPGGHCESQESPRAAAIREWQEETGLRFPDGEWTGTWTSPDGIYQGFVYTIAREADLDIFDRQLGSDPDGDVTGSETIAWMDPRDLPGNPIVRAELLADIDVVMAALGCSPGCSPDCCGAECCTEGCCNGTEGCQCGPGAMPAQGAEPVCPCGTPVVYDEMNGWQHGDGSVSHDDGESVSEKMGPVAKAADADPKDRKHRRWPGWDLDLEAVEHWAPLLAAALTAALTKAQAERIARDWIAARPGGQQDTQGKREAVEAATAWLAAQGVDLTGAVAALMPGMLTDACLIGGASAAAMTDGGDTDLGGWQPGDMDAARRRVEVLGLGAGLAAALATSDHQAEQVAGGYMTRLGRALVDGAASGLGAAAAGASLLAALSDPQDPAGSVLTTIAAGMGSAALALYRLLSVQQLAFITAGDAKVCPRCEQCAAGSPYAARRVPGVPQHGRCRCAIVPA